MKYGDRVEYNQVLKRIYRYEQKDRYSTRIKEWKIVEISTNKTGMFLGYRWLSDGVTDWDSEVGYIYTPKKYFKAMLVSPSEKENPVYVPMKGER
jgi:hypothetical protein